jgi:hypothetical protein
MFFTSREMLTDDASGGDFMLYEYAAKTDTLTFVAGGLPVSAAVVAIADDGSHVYFVSNRQLDHGEGVDGQPNLYEWGDGHTAYVATLSVNDVVAVIYRPYTEREAATNPSGTVLAFISEMPLTGFDNVNSTDCVGVGGACPEAYRYDAVSGQLICVSCNGTRQAPLGRASLVPMRPATPSRALTQRRLPRNISVDGSRMFFETQDQLVAADTNGPFGPFVTGWRAGGTDVYEWHDGRVSLISSGKSSDDAWFMDSSPDGRDVFFVTAESLVPRDVDNGDVDVYDARRGGGNALEGSAAATQCSGDACQGAASQAPLDTAIASAGFTGPGDVSAPSAGKPSGKALAQARRLPKARKACKRRKGSRRKKCESHVRGRYGKQAAKSRGGK